MRLKEDSKNYKAASLKKKEFRESSPMEDMERRKSKKNTKRWCKGKVGIEHRWEKIVPINCPTILRHIWRMNVCSICGKQDWRTLERVKQ